MYLRDHCVLPVASSFPDLILNFPFAKAHFLMLPQVYGTVCFRTLSRLTQYAFLNQDLRVNFSPTFIAANGSVPSAPQIRGSLRHSALCINVLIDWLIGLRAIARIYIRNLQQRSPYCLLIATNLSTPEGWTAWLAVPAPVIEPGPIKLLCNEARRRAP